MTCNSVNGVVFGSSGSQPLFPLSANDENPHKSQSSSSAQLSLASTPDAVPPVSTFSFGGVREKATWLAWCPRLIGLPYGRS